LLRRLEILEIVLQYLLTSLLSDAAITRIRVLLFRQTRQNCLVSVASASEV